MASLASSAVRGAGWGLAACNVQLCRLLAQEIIWRVAPEGRVALEFWNRRFKFWIGDFKWRIRNWKFRIRPGSFASPGEQEFQLKPLGRFAPEGGVALEFWIRHFKFRIGNLKFRIPP